MAYLDSPLPKWLTQPMRRQVLTFAEAKLLQWHYEAASLSPQQFMVLPERLRQASERLYLFESKGRRQ
jgi:hypothetical protein